MIIEAPDRVAEYLANASAIIVHAGFLELINDRLQLRPRQILFQRPQDHLLRLADLPILLMQDAEPQEGFREVLRPAPMRSEVAKRSTTPGSTVTVTPGATVRSPATV